ncbi:MAG TPA: cytochrome P460 family protein [Nitrospirales bacterium]
MRYLTSCLSNMCAFVCTRGIVAVGLGLVMTCGAYAEDVTVSEKSFSCISGGTKVRNTYIKHADPEKLKEAVRIFKNRVPDKEYPVGTFLQLLPGEAMVKHPRAKFPDTGGWEFFALDLSSDGTKIKSRGDKVVNFQGVTCMSCHQPAAKFDFVCEKGHGCAPVPLDDPKIAELQAADPRCRKK